MLKSLPSFRRLIHDESGNVQSTEYILMIVLLAIGGIVGLATLRDQVAQELADTGVALRQLDQSFSITIPGYSASFDDAAVGPAPPVDTAGTFPGSTLGPGGAFTAPSGELAMPAMPATNNENKNP